MVGGGALFLLFCFVCLLLLLLFLRALRTRQCTVFVCLFACLLVYTPNSRALVQNQHTRELIRARSTQHKYNNKDLSHLR